VNALKRASALLPSAGVTASKTSVRSVSRIKPTTTDKCERRDVVNRLSIQNLRVGAGRDGAAGRVITGNNE
jgi:hypothetical protein